jgi:hypothetical protein
MPNVRVEPTCHDLSDILYQLLYDQDFRDSFLDGELENRYPAITLQQREAMASIDPEELRRTANRVKTVALNGHIDGHGGLKGSFPLTFAALASNAMPLQTTVMRFLSSEAFVDYREIPYESKGVCLEEAFFHYLSVEPGIAGLDDVLFVAATELIRAILKYARFGAFATFDVKYPPFRTGAACWFAVLNHRKSWCDEYKVEPACDGPVLYAVGRRGQVIGQCPPWLGDVLVTGRHGDPDVLEHLKSVGLL